MTRRGLLVLGTLLWLAAPVRGQELLSLRRAEGRGPVEIRADSLRASDAGDRIEGEGHVRVTWGGVELTADRVVYRPQEGTAEAEGAVTLKDDDGNVLECRHLTLDVRTETGEITDGKLQLAEGGYRVWGQRFRKTGPYTYEVEEGGFTTCGDTWPAWRVEASRVRAELEGYLVARGATFWVEGAPVLYTPYLVFPVKRERQSGFLIPRFGYSDRDGAYAGIRYYWALADNADLTAALTYRSRRGWEEGIEFRYVVADGHEGQVEVTHLYDRQDEAHRSSVKASHDSRFADGSRGRLRIDYVGDTRLLKDLGDTLDDRSTERLESYLLWARDRPQGTLFTFADYFEALDSSQSTTLQTLPSLGFLGRESPLAGRLLWQPTVRATEFWRKEGTRGQRLELDPELALDLGFGGVGVAVRGGYREHLYRLEGETLSRGAARAEGTVEGTWVRRLGGLVHTLEPALRLYGEEEGRGGEPPSFDIFDEFGRAAWVGLLFESRLLRASDYAPLVGAEVEQRYDLLAPAWEPMRGEAFWTPSRFFSLRADATYDGRQEDPWLRWSGRSDARDHRGDRLFAGYRYLKGEASYADGGMELAFTPELGVQYRNRYSVRDHRTLEETYALRLANPCWEVVLSYSRNFRVEDSRDERRYYVMMNLKGLGRIGTLKGILP